MTTHRGITFRLTLVFVVFASVLVAGGGMLAYANGRQQILDGIQSELAIASTDKQSALEEWVRHLGMDVEAMSRSPALVTAVQDMLAAAPGSTQTNAAHEHVVGELSVRVGGGQPYLRWLVLDPHDGRVIADSDGQEEGKYREDRLYFVNGKAGPFVQNVYYSTALQAPAMTVSAPVMTADGRLVGVLAARIDLQEMNAIIHRRTGDRQTDDAYLVNTSSLFVTQPRLSTDPAILSQGVHTEAVRRCLEHGSGVVLADDYRGIPAITSYTWLPTRNMCLIVKVDQAEAFAPVEAFGRSVILAGGIALLAVAAIAIGMARSIMTPLLRLQEGALRFGRGELDVRLPETGRDELGRQAREFNHMAAALSSEQTQLLRRLERMYGLSSDLLCVIDFEGRFVEVNPAAGQVLGVGEGELLGTPFLELVHPADMKDTRAALASLAEGRPVTGFENRHRYTDGSWRWLLWNAAADTRERLIYAVGRDITARKREEENLRRFATVVRDSNDAITIQDFEGRITAWNHGAELMYGYGEEEALLENIERLTAPGKVEEQKDFTRRLVAGEAITSFETQRVTKDGRVLDIWLTVTKLMDDAGKSIGIASTERDITARKRTEQEIHKLNEELEQRIVERTAQVERRNRELLALYQISRATAASLDLEKTLDSAVEATVKALDVEVGGIYLLEPDGEMLRLRAHRGISEETAKNLEWVKLGEGMSGRAAVEKKPLVLDLQDYPSERLAPYIAQENLRFSVSVPLLSGGQAVGAINLSTRRVRAFPPEEMALLTAIGQQLGSAVQNARLYEGVQRELAERQRTEQHLRESTAQLEAANQELEAFSYSVSHDLRAPLRAIDGFSRIVLDEHAPALAPEAQRYLHLVQDNTQQMGRLVDDLLAFSRLSRQPMAKQPVDPADLVHAALQDLHAEQAGRQIDLVIRDLPTCQADPGLLKQVWVNLLSNALKFTRRRERAVIEVGAYEEDTHPVYYVKDNGVGFDIRYVGKLFGVFQRLHRSEEYEGTGVGLAIVQRIIHRHGGRVWAEAKVDQGATFSFMLERGTGNDEGHGGDPAGRGQSE